MPSPTKEFFQIISIMKRGSISHTLVNMVRLYTAKRIKRTWSTLSSHNWLEFSRFILHFFVLGFMILFFYVTLIFCCVDFFNGIFLHQTQLFKGRISASPSVKFNLGFFFFVQKHFLGQFSRIFIEHRITNLLTKRIKLNLLYKVMWQSKKFIFWLKIIPLRADKRYRF